MRPTTNFCGFSGSSQRTRSPKPGVPRVSIRTTSPPKSDGATEVLSGGSSGIVHGLRKVARHMPTTTATTTTTQKNPRPSFDMTGGAHHAPRARGSRRAGLALRRARAAVAVGRQLARARAQRDLVRGGEDLRPPVDAREERLPLRVLVAVHHARA